MRTSAAEPATLAHALTAFRLANGIRADEIAHGWWTCRIVRLPLRLPNFAWRRRAILAHDIHHVLTGYPCTLHGEFQMAAWELGAGRMPHWGAALFCLPLVLPGFWCIPRRMLQAFKAGRRSRSLHQWTPAQRLLMAPVRAVRAELAVAPDLRGRWADSVLFAVLVLRASIVTLSPIAAPAALWIAW
jgi:hypothetical protein